MEKINQITSRAIPMPIQHIDTDQIIPARFLKSTSREGFGENLFRDWRFNEDGGEADFVLNNKRYEGNILLAGHNFGCGSSREHAAWAIYDYGFRAVVSSEFADIFKGNALNNGLLPVTVSEEFLEFMLEAVFVNPETEIKINLENQTITCKGETYHFEIDGFKKICLMQGKQELDFLIDMKPEIQKYEKSRASHMDVIV